MTNDTITNNSVNHQHKNRVLFDAKILVCNPKKLTTHNDDDNGDDKGQHGNNINNPNHRWHKQLIKEERIRNILAFRLDNYLIVLPGRSDEKLDFVARQATSNFFDYVGREIEFHVCQVSATINEYRNEIDRVTKAFLLHVKSIAAKILVEENATTSVDQSFYIIFLTELLNYYAPNSLIGVRSLWDKEQCLKLPRLDLTILPLFNAEPATPDGASSTSGNFYSLNEVELALRSCMEALDSPRSSLSDSKEFVHISNNNQSLASSISHDINKMLESHVLGKKTLFAQQPIFISKKRKRRFHINFAAFQIKIALIIGFAIGMITMSIVYAAIL